MNLSTRNIYHKNNSNKKQIIEYDQALKFLHDELFSIQLMN